MRTLKIALMATVATAALSSATLAADLIIADPIIDNTYIAPGFDWDGAYAGLFVFGQASDSIWAEGFGVGANIGANMMFDSSLLGGIEGSVSWLSTSDDLAEDSWQGQVHGKLGFVADSVAIYGLFGAGFNSETEAYLPIGVGAEFAVADDFTIKAEYQYQWDLEDTLVVGTSESAHVGKLGFNWHF